MEVQSIKMEEMPCQECEAVGPLHLQPGEAMMVLSSFGIQTRAHGTLPLTLGLGLLISFNMM